MRLTSNVAVTTIAPPTSWSDVALSVPNVAVHHAAAVIFTSSYARFAANNAPIESPIARTARATSPTNVSSGPPGASTEDAGVDTGAYIGGAGLKRLGIGADDGLGSNRVGATRPGGGP